MVIHLALPGHAILGSGVLVFVLLGQLEIEHGLVFVARGSERPLELEDGDRALVAVGIVRLTKGYVAGA